MFDEVHYRENEFCSSPDSLRMGASQQYSSTFYYYEDDIEQEKESADSPINRNNHQSHIYSAIHSATISCSSLGQPYSGCPLGSSTNQLPKHLHGHNRLPVNNSFINSTTPTSGACFANRIPLPGELEANSNGSFDSDSMIRLRNLRERNRVRNVNDGFDRLRKHLPNQLEFKKDKRLSKVQTLKMAITYIRQLESILNSNKQMI